MSNYIGSILGQAIIGKMVLGGKETDALDLITDRSQSDLENLIRLVSSGWENMTETEREEFLLSSKGAYNVSDLNRVGNAVDVIARKLKDAGNVLSVNPKTDWTTDDIPSTEQMEEYLDNIREIRGVLAVLYSTPAVPSRMRKLTLQKANDIEQILVDVNGLINKMQKSYYYSGELYGGER